jgi:acylphosphatase
VSGEERLTALVRGRVQGVGYRWWAVDVATGLGLVGFVRNADDDEAVEVVAEGSPAALDRFQAELARGPSAARVDDVDSTREPAAGGLIRFEIRR